MLRSKRKGEDDQRASRSITITNSLALHGRPAAEFAHQARAFRSEVWLVKEGERFSAASLIEIPGANLLQGATATLEAKGRDVDEAVERLARLLRDFKD